MTDETPRRRDSITEAVRRATADRLPPLRIDVERAGPLDVRSVEVDGNGARTFLVIERATGAAVLVDPTGDRARVFELIADARDAAEDADAPVPFVAEVVLTMPPRDDAGRELRSRVERRLGTAAVALPPRPEPDPLAAEPTMHGEALRIPNSRDAMARRRAGLPSGYVDESTMTVRIRPLRGLDPQGAVIAIDAPGAPTQLFVGEALGASGPANVGHDRAAAMRLVMDLERNLLAPNADDAVVRARRAEPVTVGELRDRTTAWRRGFGLPASRPDSPVWFTSTGRALRRRRMQADPSHPDHRFVMLMVGATVHAVLDPDDPFAFLPAYGVYPQMAAFLGLERPDVPEADRTPMRVLHLGAGALAIPRTIAAARPGSLHEVVDIDPTVFAFVRAHLPCPDTMPMNVHVDDARVELERFVARRIDPARSDPADAAPGPVPNAAAAVPHLAAAAADTRRAFDAIVVDVFDGLTVPARISSVEAFATARRALAPTGRVVVNLPADPGSTDAHRVVAALREVFPHVAVAGPADAVEARASGNVVAAASASPIDADDVRLLLREQHAVGEPQLVLDGDALTAWLGDAMPLRDDNDDNDDNDGDNGDGDA